MGPKKKEKKKVEEAKTEESGEYRQIASSLFF